MWLTVTPEENAESKEWAGNITKSRLQDLGRVRPGYKASGSSFVGTSAYLTSYPLISAAIIIRDVFVQPVLCMHDINDIQGVFYTPQGGYNPPTFVQHPRIPLPIPP